MEMTARDAEILRMVNRHRFLRSHQIADLVGGSGQQVLRRLQIACRQRGDVRLLIDAVCSAPNRRARPPTSRCLCLSLPFATVRPAALA
jgi:hypothetical protein